jgi:DNA-binding transcriptional regulator YiaG
VFICETAASVLRYVTMTAKQVRAIRRRLGLTQAELARRVGVARVSVARWELGITGIRQSAAILLKRLDKEHKADGKD